MKASILAAVQASFDSTVLDLLVPLLHTLVDVWVHLVALLTIDQLGDPKRVVFVPSTILNANKVANFPFYLA